MMPGEEYFQKSINLILPVEYGKKICFCVSLSAFQNKNGGHLHLVLSTKPMYSYLFKYPSPTLGICTHIHFTYKILKYFSKYFSPACLSYVKTQKSARIKKK